MLGRLSTIRHIIKPVSCFTKDGILIVISGEIHFKEDYDHYDIDHHGKFLLTNIAKNCNYYDILYFNHDINIALRNRMNIHLVNNNCKLFKLNFYYSVTIV